jgi:hypothetical protein
MALRLSMHTECQAYRFERSNHFKAGRGNAIALNRTKQEEKMAVWASADHL